MKTEEGPETVEAPNEIKLENFEFRKCGEPTCIASSDGKGVLCCVCTIWICNDCVQWDKSGSFDPTAPLRSFCLPCFNVEMLRRFPRPNYDPNARVIPEVRYHIDFAQVARQRPAQIDRFIGQVGKTLLELAYMPWPSIEPTSLAMRHSHNMDKTVRLDETNNKHDYFVRYTLGAGEESEFLQSTSNMVHQYFPNLYNKYEALCAMLNGAKWGPAHPKYAAYFSENETEQVSHLRRLLRDWQQINKDALTLGKFVHFLLECNINAQLELAKHPIYSNPSFANIQQFLRWRSEHFDPYFEPYRTEMQLRSSEKFRRVGTCDLLAVRRNHPPPAQTGGVLSLVMFDWKNCLLKKESFGNRRTGYEMGLPPMDRHMHCNREHYNLQLEDYTRMLTAYTDFHFKGHVYARAEITSSHLVLFHPENPKGEAVVEDLDNLQRELDIIWQQRAACVDAWIQGGRRPTLPEHKTPELNDEQETALIVNMVQEYTKRKEAALELEQSLHVIETGSKHVRDYETLNKEVKRHKQ